MRLITQNVKSLPLMSQGRVVHDVELCAQEAGIILWQEIRPERYRKAVRDLAPVFDVYFPESKTKSGATVLGGQPISWRTRYWERVDCGSILMNSAVPKVCDNRYLSWVLLKRENADIESLVLVHDAHYVARAWAPDGSAKPRHDPAEAKEQPMRQEMWNSANAIHHAALSGWVKEGYPIAGGGDYNRHGVLPFGDTLVGTQHKVYYPVQPLGLDWLNLIDGRTARWNIKDFSVQKQRFSDHQGRLVEASLKRR